MRFLAPLLAFVGRLTMAAVMLQAGVTKALAPAATMASFTKQGLAAVPAAYAITLTVELAVAAALLVGWRARSASFILACWCVATAFVVHFVPADRGQMLHFMKNLCMAGGFLQIAAYGAGRFSFDRR
jgi:putative oxidoreductase